MLNKPYRKRPIENIIRDIRAIKQLERRPFIELADDNTFVDHSWGRELCRQLIPERIKWFTETDISVASDEELLGLMRESRCKQVLIGLESPNQTSLDGIEQNSNFKCRQKLDYCQAIETIQGHGITVNGCFIFRVRFTHA